MNLTEKIIVYLRGTREEIRKVSWPSRKETVRYSALVVGASIIVAVFFATLDLGFTQLVDVAVTQRATRRTQSAEQTPPPTNVPTSSRPASDVQTVTPTFDLKSLETTTGSGSIHIVK